MRTVSLGVVTMAKLEALAGLSGLAVAGAGVMAEPAAAGLPECDAVCAAGFVNGSLLCRHGRAPKQSDLWLRNIAASWAGGCAYREGPELSPTGPPREMCRCGNCGAFMRFLYALRDVYARGRRDGMAS